MLGPAFRFEAIVPRRKGLVPPGIRKRLELEMRTLAADLWRICENYETPPPDPRVYVRTNTLKRSWSRKVEVGRDLVGTVQSSGQIAPYNVYVRGPVKGRKHKRQAAHMRARGWLSVTDIMDVRWPKSRERFRRIMHGR